MDAIDRRESTLAASKCRDEWEGSALFEEYVAEHNADPEFWYKQIETRSLTIPIWFQDQYEKDLAIWEQESRKHLLAGCENGETLR
jgi:hypothetical protein